MNTHIADIKYFNINGENLKSAFYKICGNANYEDSATGDFSDDLKTKCCSPSSLPLGLPIEILIEDYRSVHWCQFEACISMLSTVLDLIVGEVNEGNSDCIPPFKRSTHQYCMPNKTVMAACDLFSQKQDELATATDFEQLRQVVFKLTDEHLPRNVRKGSDSNQFGWLACYDFAMRYGYHRMGNLIHKDFNLYPRSVYLHAGALVGAKALCDCKKLNKKWLAKHKDLPGTPIFIPFEELEKMTEFPQGLTNLIPNTDARRLSEEEKQIIQMKRPMHLENFLCIYGLHLKYLAGTVTLEEIENFKQKIKYI